MRILGISGSLRRGSHNSELLRAAADLLPPGVELEWFHGLKAIPPYDEDDDVEPAPPAVSELREAIASADAVLFATPEYNASIPGQLKNALDWASRPFPENALRGKPVAVIGASTGMFGGVWAQAELRKVLGAIGARVLDRDLPVAAAHVAFLDGRLHDDQHHTTLENMLASWWRRSSLIGSRRERRRVQARDGFAGARSTTRCSPFMPQSAATSTCSRSWRQRLSTASIRRSCAAGCAGSRVTPCCGSCASTACVTAASSTATTAPRTPTSSRSCAPPTRPSIP